MNKSQVETILQEDGKCFVCGEMTNSLVANPEEWVIFLPHIDGEGKHRYYHIKCLYPILKGGSDE